MKRLIILSLFTFTFVFAFSQVVIQDYEFKRYIDKDSLSWPQKAKKLSLEYKLNDNGELKLTDIKKFEGQTKKELYQKVLNWIMSFSKDPVVLIADEEKGRIETGCCFSYSFRNGMMRNSLSRTSIKPLLQFDFKDEKVRFVYTLRSFEEFKLKKSTDCIMFIGTNTKIQELESMIEVQTHYFENSYPFVKNNPKSRNKLFNGIEKSNTTSFNTAANVSSRIYVNSIALYHLLKDRMVDVLTKKEVLTNNDNDW